MEPNRQRDRVAATTMKRQAGVTALGFLMLASVFGVVGLGGIKLTPMYLQNMRLSRVLEDVKAELDGKGTTASNIRISLNKHFDIEGLRDLPPDSVKISQARNGYSVRIQHDNRAPFIADVWLLVEFDEQVEIRR